MDVNEEIGSQLLNDYDRGAVLLNADPSDQFLRRNLVRTAFAAVEGINNYVKRSIYDYHERNVRPTFHASQVLKFPPLHRIFEQIQSDSELLLLLEHTSTLDGDGNVRLKEAFQPVATSIRFMFKMASAVFCPHFAPAFSDHRWHDLQSAIKIRNRLTHPKALSDLEVRDDELKVLERGIQWYLDNVGELMRSIAETLSGVHSSIHGYIRTLPKDKFLDYMRFYGGSSDEGPLPNFDHLKFPLKDHHPDL